MEISVVYLAYYNEEAEYKLDTVENFLNSYEKFSAGGEHSLVILAKNWTNLDEYNKLSQLAENHKAKIINVPDDGWDFGAYFRAVRLLDTEYVLFLGSSTNILCNNWLSYFINAFESDKSIQMVGAMGSWGSLFVGLNFPNYHIRTCSFMIKRELFLEYSQSQKFPVTKIDTYEIEHGRTSITNFVLNKGGKAVVVNSDGEIFAPEYWWNSNTFRSHSESKSIFSDRQTNIYSLNPDIDKEFLERAAWGQSLKKTKVKIFVSYDKKAPLLQSEVFQSIFLNSDIFKDTAFTLRDNIGDNISSKYDYYGTLTAQYWVWKNYLPKMDIEYIGFFQSNRVLDFNSNQPSTQPFKPILLPEFAKEFQQYNEERIITKIDSFDVILPYKTEFKKSVYDNYAELYSQELIDTIIGVIKEICPQYVDVVCDFMESNEMYTCLNFIMKRELVNEYMSWMFNVLDVIEQRVKFNQFSNENKIAEKIAEILFNIWLRENIVANKIETLSLPGFSIYCDMNLYLADCAQNVET